MNGLGYIFDRNTVWASERVNQDHEYFSRLASVQTPKILWIGCSDSRVSANVICGLEPGEVFVHRNVGNLVCASDLNCMSALQYAVEELMVEHIVLCGHYGCGAVHAALGDARPGLIRHWLEPICELAREHREILDLIPDADRRRDYLCELNVRNQIINLAHSPIIQGAWNNGQPLALHGWIYKLSDGRLRDLHCTRWNSRVQPLSTSHLSIQNKY